MRWTFPCSMLLAVTLFFSFSVTVTGGYATTQLTRSLTIEKVVDNQDSGLNLSPADFEITVIFTDNGVQTRETFSGSETPKTFNKEDGVQWRILERNLRDDVAVSSPTHSPTGCDFGQFSIGSPTTCTITNHISARGPTTETGTAEGTEGAATSPTSEQRTEIATTEVGTAVVPTGGKGPFQTCAAPKIVSGTADDANREFVNEDVFYFPSSATYTIDGTTSIDDLFESLQENNDLTIILWQDTKENDGVTLGTPSPVFIGQFFVGEDPELFPSEAIKYYIDDISTSCDYVTLTDPISSKADERFHPLANTSNIDPDDFDFKGNPPENLVPNDLLVYCAQDTKISNNCLFVKAEEEEEIKKGFVTNVINPPFRSCENTLKEVTTGSDSNKKEQTWAEYIIKAKAGMIPVQTFIDLVSGSSRGTLEIKVVADTVTLNDDEIKIVDSNNPFLKIYLVVNPDKPTATRVPLEIQQVFTRCNGAGFIDDPQVN